MPPHTHHTRRLPWALAMLLAGAGLLALGVRFRAPDTAAPRDAAGGAPPTRIVSMSPSATEMLFALGLGERVVGVTRFCTYPPTARDKPTIGGYYDPNYEAIIALKPDLVILLRDHEEAQARLTAIGIPSLAVGYRTVPDILDAIRRIGRACNAETPAEAMLADIATRLSAVRAKTAGRPRPRTLVSIGRDIGGGNLRGVTIAGEDGFFSALLELAGASNAYRGTALPFPAISREGLLELDPEVIFDLAAALDADRFDSVKAQAEWNTLDQVSAVRHGRVHILAGSHVTIPGPRFILLLEQMARAVHPEAEWE